MKQIIMWICPNCEEPNSCNGSVCPYCSYKGKKFEQKRFIVMDIWIKNKAMLIDKAIRRIKKDRWLYRIPEDYWLSLTDIEKGFLFKIQAEIDKESKPSFKKEKEVDE